MWKNFAIVCTIVVLNFGRQIAELSSTHNRVYYHWSRFDGFAIIIAILSCTLILTLIRRLILHYLPNIRLLTNHVAAIALFSGLVSQLEVIIPLASRWYSVIWLILVGVIAFSLGRESKLLIRATRNFCLVLSPLPIFLFWQLLSGPQFEEKPEHFPALSKPSKMENDIPIYFFVFDEWSYDRSTQDGVFRKELPNLRKLASRSTMFRSAYSRYSNTASSVPAILYQTSEELSVIKQLSNPNGLRKLQETPSIFEMLNRPDYNKILLGFYFPYRHMLMGQADYVSTFASDRHYSNLFENSLVATLRNSLHLSDTFSRLVHDHIYQSIISKSWYQFNMNFHDRVRQIIKQAPNNFMGFFHWPCTHFPLVINPDGSYAGNQFHFPLTLHNYWRHIRYLDSVIGDIITSLETTNKFDQSLLIFTSDHAWKHEGDVSVNVDDKVLRHVPLLIKLPHQRTGVLVDHEVLNNQLWPIINAVLNGESDPEDVLKLVTIANSGDAEPPKRN